MLIRSVDRKVWEVGLDDERKNLVTVIPTTQVEQVVAITIYDGVQFVGTLPVPNRDTPESLEIIN